MRCTNCPTVRRLDGQKARPTWRGRALSFAARGSAMMGVFSAERIESWAEFGVRAPGDAQAQTRDWMWQNGNRTRCLETVVRTAFAAKLQLRHPRWRALGCRPATADTSQSTLTAHLSCRRRTSRSTQAGFIEPRPVLEGISTTTRQLLRCCGRHAAHKSKRQSANAHGIVAGSLCSRT